MRLVLSGVLLILCLIGGSAKGAPVTIRLTLQLPPESLLFQNIKQFADRVAEQSKGELKLSCFPPRNSIKRKRSPKRLARAKSRWALPYFRNMRKCSCLPRTFFRFPFSSASRRCLRQQLRPRAAFVLLLTEPSEWRPEPGSYGGDRMALRRWARNPDP